VADQAPAEAATSAPPAEPVDKEDEFDPQQADEEMGPVGLFTEPGGEDVTEEETADWDDEESATAPTFSPLAVVCAAGTVRLFRLRGNGTTRRLMWLTGEALEVAEWYRLRLDQGASVRQIAEECQTSRATVRRALGVIDLMDAIEAGEHDDLYEEGVTEVLFASDEDGDEQ
jgi:hypothetical protein